MLEQFLADSFTLPGNIKKAFPVHVGMHLFSWNWSIGYRGACPGKYRALVELLINMTFSKKWLFYAFIGQNMIFYQAKGALTCMVDVIEGRNVIMCNVLRAFVQTSMDKQIFLKLKVIQQMIWVD